jgi:hypothetical protein
MVQMSITCVMPQEKMNAMNSHATQFSAKSPRLRTKLIIATGIEK